MNGMVDGWPFVHGGFDARDAWPEETAGFRLGLSSWPYPWQARYSDVTLRSAERPDGEWGTGPIGLYFEDGVRFMQAAWERAAPGAWYVINIGDVRLNTGGSGAQVSKAGQRVYRQDPSHGLEGAQWALAPERAAIAVQERTQWQLAGKVVWKKPVPVLADVSAYHLRRNRRPGKQHEMLFWWVKPDPSGAKPTFHADVLLGHRPAAALAALGIMERLRSSRSRLLARLEREGVVLSRAERQALTVTQAEWGTVERALQARPLLGDVWDLPKHTSEPPWASPSDEVRSWPDELPRRLIELLTDPGDLVVDMCSGYGVAGKAAAELGRRQFMADLFWSTDQLRRRRAAA